MKTITPEERETATLIPLGSVLSGEDDTEKAFEDYRAGFHEGEEPGVVRAYELLIDERGNVGTRQMQNRLGSWPIDAYKFDELCAMLIEQFMDPGQNRMAVRLTGTKKDQSGYMFNKIIMLKRPQGVKKETSSNTGESTASILKLLQENNERMIAMFQRMQPAQEQKADPMAELQKLMTVSAALNGPMNQMLQLLIPALAGRPLPAAQDPFASMSGMLDVVEKLKDISGGGGNDSDDGVVGIIRALTPLAKPALEAIPALAALAPRQLPPAAVVNPAPRPNTGAGGGAGPMRAPATGSAPAAPPPNVGAGGGAPIQPTDIPTGDSQMLAQLKPQIDQLVAMATQGADPVAAADLVFDQVFLSPQLPEQIFEQLADFVDNEKFLSYVTTMNPAAKPHAAWFESFKTQIVQRLNVEDEAAPAENAPVANTH